MKIRRKAGSKGAQGSPLPALLLLSTALVAKL